jgi:hypothetical protein
MRAPVIAAATARQSCPVRVVLETVWSRDRQWRGAARELLLVNVPAELARREGHGLLSTKTGGR